MSDIENTVDSMNASLCFPFYGSFSLEFGCHRVAGEAATTAHHRHLDLRGLQLVGAVLEHPVITPSCLQVSLRGVALDLPLI